jgi:hypothetical protein
MGFMKTKCEIYRSLIWMARAAVLRATLWLHNFSGRFSILEHSHPPLRKRKCTYWCAGAWKKRRIKKQSTLFYAPLAQFLSNLRSIRICRLIHNRSCALTLCRSSKDTVTFWIISVQYRRVDFLHSLIGCEEGYKGSFGILQSQADTLHIIGMFTEETCASYGYGEWEELCDGGLEEVSLYTAVFKTSWYLGGVSWPLLRWYQVQDCRLFSKWRMKPSSTCEQVKRCPFDMFTKAFSDPHHTRWINLS